jgi:hypothetical protein
MAGCTQIPTKEFTSYKEAFNNARSAGEQVILDYGAALNEDQRDRESRQPVAATNESKDSVPREFKTSDIATQDKARDVILVRMLAWDVVARYNDVLTGLAEGRSARELTIGVEGLVDSLESFPIEEVTEKIGSIAPFMGVLQSVLSMAAQERSRQVFMELLDEGAPLIQNKFIKLLRDDEEDFYDVRLGLRDRAFSRQRDQLGNHAEDFYNLMKEYKETPNLKSVTAKAKAVLDEFVGSKQANMMKPNPDARKIVTPLVESQLNELLSNMEAKARKMEAIDAELLAYRQMLFNYDNMIIEVSDTLNKLEQEARNDSMRLPSTKDLINVYIDLQQAYETYRTAQRSML